MTDAARLIAEMMEACSWSIPHSCAGHPILGQAIEIRRKRYEQLVRTTDFTTARIEADATAIRFIMEMLRTEEASAAEE